MSGDRDNLIKKICYRSWHCGARELDLLFGSFAEARVAGFSDAELAAFERLLVHDNPDLMAWLAGDDILGDDGRSSVALAVLDFARMRRVKGE